MHQIGAGRVLASLYFKRVVLPRLLIVVHLDSGVVRFDGASRGKVVNTCILFELVIIVTMGGPALEIFSLVMR